MCSVKEHFSGFSLLDRMYSLKFGLRCFDTQLRAWKFFHLDFNPYQRLDRGGVKEILHVSTLPSAYA